MENNMTYEERKSSEVAEVLYQAICDLESEFDPCHPIIERLEEMYRYYTEEQQHDL
jgi:hypothetical protein